VSYRRIRLPILGLPMLLAPVLLAAEAPPPWWDKDYPLRIEVEVKVPASLHTEQPIEIPIKWPADKSGLTDFDWKCGRAVERTAEGPKPLGNCQRSPVFSLEPAGANGKLPTPGVEQPRTAPAGSYQLAFILPPQKEAKARKFHLYFPPGIIEDEMRDEELPICVTDKEHVVPNQKPVPYHEIRTGLTSFSLRPGWNSVAGVHGFRPDKEFAFGRFLRFYRMGYREKTVSPYMRFRLLEVGAVRATFEMADKDGTVPHRFLWHTYVNGDIHVEHRWIEGTTLPYWIFAEQGNIQYWQFETSRLPQEKGKGFRGHAARFLVLHSAAANSVTLLLNRPIHFNIAFSGMGRWERLVSRYRKVGLDEAFDDAEALCQWQDATDVFRVGEIETTKP